MARLEGLEPPTYRFEVNLTRRINSLHKVVSFCQNMLESAIHAGLNRVERKWQRTLTDRG